MKALIIEDTEHDFVIVSDVLSSLKHKSTSASSVASAIKKLNDEEYDMIFLDLNLLDSSGLETIEEIKEAKQSSVLNLYTPIIVLTGMDDFSTTKKALKAGARDYLVKGEFGIEDIERAIRYATISHLNPKRNWVKRLFS